jgi:hypothetical protein
MPPPRALARENNTESVTLDELALSPQRVAELVEARKQSAKARAVHQPVVHIQLAGLKALALDTHSAPLLVLVWLTERWSRSGRTQVSADAIEIEGVSEEEKLAGLAALLKAGILKETTK